MEGRAKVTLQDAHDGVSYKYAVLQPNGKELWECLIGFKPLVSGHVNRCLIIPESSIKGNSKCVQNLLLVFIKQCICKKHYHGITSQNLLNIACDMHIRKIKVIF